MRAARERSEGLRDGFAALQLPLRIAFVRSTVNELDQLIRVQCFDTAGSLIPQKLFVQRIIEAREWGTEPVSMDMYLLTGATSVVPRRLCSASSASEELLSVFPPSN